MAKFYGAIGYIVDEKSEDHPDVTFEKPVEKFCKGDLLKNYRGFNKTDELNGEITISNQVSITADPYALSHIFAMRYVKWMGVAWSISSVDVQYPRLILTLGGVYHGETAQ